MHEDICVIQRILLAMCEQNNTNLSNANVGDLIYPTTAPGMSPATLQLRGLSIHRPQSGGSAAPSPHSSVHSTRSGEFTSTSWHILHAYGFLGRAHSRGQSTSRHSSRGRAPGGFN